MLQGYRELRQFSELFCGGYTSQRTSLHRIMHVVHQFVELRPRGALERGEYLNSPRGASVEQLGVFGADMRI